MTRKLPLIAALFLAAISAGAQEGRGITSLSPSNYPFVLKGAWSVGGSAGMSTNFGADLKGYSLDLSPEFSHAIADNLEIGFRGYYHRGLTDIGHAGLDIEGITIAVDDYWMLSHHYGGAAFLRKYLPIGSSGRIALYVDAQIGARGGQGINTDSENGSTVGTYQKDFSFMLDVKPGIAVSVTPLISITGGLGIAGIGFSSTEQVHNQVSSGKVRGFEAYYAMNPLSLSIGSRFTLVPGKRPEGVGGREFKSYSVVRKGESMANFGLILASGNSANSELLLLADGIDGKGSITSFSPQASYAYRNNAAIGVRAHFTSGDVHIGHLATGLPGSDLNLDLNDVDARFTSVGASVFHRNYMGLDRKGTFGAFCEVAVTGAQNKITAGESELLDNFSMKAVLSPGIIVYVLPFVSLEASAGIADMSLVLGEQTRLSGGVRFNLLNCKFGVSYHL